MSLIWDFMVSTLLDTMLVPQSDFTGRDSRNPSFVANLRSWYLQLHVIWILSPAALLLSLFCIRVLFSFPTQAATDYLCGGVSGVDCGQISMAY